MDSQENSESNNIVDQADNKSLTESTITPVEWSRENEEILVEWCDVAQCYKWLNLRAHTKYSYLHAWFTIPAITLSTITGTASFAQSSLPAPYRTYAPMLIGAVNIFIGILTTIQQYLKISELNEAHRVSMISWDKFSRNIRIELAKRSEERVEAGQFLKICRNEYDRLMESSPIIPDKVVQEFNEKFRGKEGSTKRKHFDKIRKPDICSTIISVSELLENENIIEDQSVLELADAKKNELISEQTQKIDEMARLIESQKQAKDNELAEKKRRVEHESRKTQERLEKSKQAMDKINTYIVDFKGVYDRDPIADEIENNVEVEEKYMKEFLSSYNV
jgi:hypothetical protein